MVMLVGLRKKENHGYVASNWPWDLFEYSLAYGASVLVSAVPPVVLARSLRCKAFFMRVTPTATFAGRSTHVPAVYTTSATSVMTKKSVRGCTVSLAFMLGHAYDVRTSKKYEQLFGDATNDTAAARSCGSSRSHLNENVDVLRNGVAFPALSKHGEPFSYCSRRLRPRRYGSVESWLIVSNLCSV